jgi:serine/threonine-protein kinase CTR1
MPLGLLYDVLHGKNESITLSWSDRYSSAWQMAKSINYLHNLKPYIIHRDMKSMSFLMKRNGSEQHQFLLKVCDFDLAEIRRENLLQSLSSHIVGSSAWKAPELLTSHQKHTKQTDIYSLGITMWELATGKKPWDE